MNEAKEWLKQNFPYLSDAEEQLAIKAFEAGMEKLKNCDNCTHVKYDWNEQLRIGKCENCTKYSNWEIRK